VPTRALVAAVSWPRCDDRAGIVNQAAINTSKHA
jgi:hypothetical protein